MKTIVLGMMTVLLLGGCAFSNTELDLGISEEDRAEGPLSSIAQREFVVSELVDGRPDTQRIGWKKNGYGVKTADILTDEPVPQIVSNSIGQALVNNGHVMADEGIQINGTINQFWFEWDQNFFTVEFIGNVECELVFTTTAGDEIYRSNYSGSYSTKKGGGGKKVWTSVMNEALAALAEEIAYDEDLVAALE